MLKNLFLSAGAMKSGTSWLYHVMRHHPQIHFSKRKEIHYFAHQAGIANILSFEKRKQRSDQVIDRLNKKFNRSRITEIELLENMDWYKHYMGEPLSNEWYCHLFDQYQRNRADIFCADFSNLSCHLESQDWELVRKTTGNLKVIYTLRDPVQRLWSHYKFHLKFTDHPQQDVQNVDIEQFKSIVSNTNIFRNSLYSRNIRKMNSSLSASEFKIFYLDDFSNSPLATLNLLHQFLGISEFNYPDLDLQARRNTSADIGIPKEWKDYLGSMLGDEIAELKSLGLFRDNWTDL